MRTLLLLLAFINVSTASSQTLIKNVNLIDVIKQRIITAQDVLIQDGKITAIGKNLKSNNATIIDATGKWLGPGFVDAHIHFFQSGGLYARPDVIDLRKHRPYTDEIKWGHSNMDFFARHYLAAGITTVIDVGATYNFLKQRDTMRSNPMAGRILMTGPLLTTWEPPVYKGLKNDQPFLEMKNLEDAERLVEQQLEYKPDFIKIWYIVEGTNKDSVARIHLPMVKKVIDLAHRNNLKVAIHATERITAQLSIEAGADFLVHSIEDEEITNEFVQLLKRKGTVLCPTLIVFDNYMTTLGQNYVFTREDHRFGHPHQLNTILDFKNWPDSNFRKRYKEGVAGGKSSQMEAERIMKINLKKLLDGGVAIATGTDAGNIGTQHVSSYFAELKAMMATGFNLWQLYTASSLNGAKALGKESEFGSINIGKSADMLLFSKNPLESLDNWQSTDLIMYKGRMFKPGELMKRTPEQLADQQLAAYNAHNLEAFLAPYSDSVEIYEVGGSLLMKGKEAMRKQYQFIEMMPQLYCRLLNRMVQGNTVIDHEEVFVGRPKPEYAFAIYKIANGLIQQVYFTQ